jgi:hypothetical protein
MKIQKQEVFLLSNNGREEVGKKTANFFFHPPSVELEKGTTGMNVNTEKMLVGKKPTRKPLISEKFLHFMNKLGPQNDSGIMNTRVSPTHIFPVLRNPNLASHDDQTKKRPNFNGGSFHLQQEQFKRESDEFSFLIQANSRGTLLEPEIPAPLNQQCQSAKHQQTQMKSVFYGADDQPPLPAEQTHLTHINRIQRLKNVKRPAYIPWKVHSEESEDTRNMMKSRGKTVNLYPEFFHRKVVRPEPNKDAKLHWESMDRSLSSNLAAIKEQPHHIRPGYVSAAPSNETQSQNESTGLIKRGRRQLSSDKWKPPQEGDRRAAHKSFHAIKPRPEKADEENRRQVDRVLYNIDSKVSNLLAINFKKAEQRSSKKGLSIENVYRKQDDGSALDESKNLRRSNLKLLQVLSQIPSQPIT